MLTDTQLAHIADELKKLLPPATGFTLTIVPINNLGPARVRFITNLEGAAAKRMAEHVAKALDAPSPGLIVPS